NSFAENFPPPNPEALFVRLQHRTRKLRHFCFHFGASHEHRRTSDRLRAAAEGTNTLFDDTSVAMVDGDVLDRDAKLIREHLRERRLVALPVRRDTGRPADAAIPFNRHLGMLPATDRKNRGWANAAHFHVHGQSETDQPAFSFGGITFRLQSIPLSIL